jgi:hypothetical protein
MRVYESLGGIQILLSNAEFKTLDSLDETCKNDMSPRQAYIAQQLVSKGVATKTVKEGKVYFSKAKGSI